MSNTKILLSVVLILFVLTGCGAGNNAGTPNVNNQGNPAQSTQAVANSNPYPAITSAQTTTNAAYPNPESGITGSNLSAQYLVDKLVLPTASQEKGVITGQLLVGGNTSQPYIITLYLASTIPASDASKPPVVNFSRQTDPIATFEKSSGRFMFSDVAPGKYALVVSPGPESYFIQDSSGNTLIIEVQAGQVTDLGVIPIK